MSAVALQAKPKGKSGREVEAGRSDVRPKTIFEAVARYGEDGDFKPIATPGAKKNFIPTDAPPGSDEKINVLRQRLEKGLPLWHRCDRKDYVSGGAQPIERLFAQAAQIADRSISESFADLEQDYVYEFDAGDAPEKTTEQRSEVAAVNPASELAHKQEFSSQDFSELTGSQGYLRESSTRERATGRGKNRSRGPAVVANRDFNLIEQLARRALEKRLSSQRRELNKDMSTQSTLRESRVREHPVVITSSSADPFSSLRMPPRGSERATPQSDAPIRTSERHATFSESEGSRVREASLPPTTVPVAESTQAANLEVLQVYRALKEAVALNRILPTELKRFQEQHRDLLGE